MTLFEYKFTATSAAGSYTLKRRITWPRFSFVAADSLPTNSSVSSSTGTDTVTSFIFREYRDRSNVGYGTLLAMVYLVIIIVVMTVLMKVADRFARPRT